MDSPSPSYTRDGDVRLKMKNRAPQIESIHSSLVHRAALPIPLHLISLGGRENYKFDHLDKQRTYQPFPPAKPSRAPVLDLTTAHSGSAPHLLAKPNPLAHTHRLTAHTALTAHEFAHAMIG